MAKCSICTKTKGKRKCLAFGGTVCNRCCGTSRNVAECEGCTFYKTGQEMRRYQKTPYFTTHQMAGNQELQEAANVIDGAICSFDLAQQRNTGDSFYESMLERLLDRYHFGDDELSFSDDLEKDGFAFMEEAIHKDLPSVEHELLTKIIGAVYRSIKRHTHGHREYIDFVYRHVGIRADTGVRVLTIPETGRPVTHR